jgi:hypothetical protein
MNHEKALVGDLGQALVESWAIELALLGWWLENNHLSNSSNNHLGEKAHSITQSCQFVDFYFYIHIYIWIWIFVCVHLCIFIDF